MKGRSLDKRKLDEYGIGLVYLFGSAVLEIEHPLSDIDIGIVFKDKSAKKRDWLRVYMNLYNIFGTIYKGEKIDLIFLEEAPLSLQFDVINYGKVLYRVSPEFEANYREYVAIRYMDFKWVEEECTKTVLEGKYVPISSHRQEKDSSSHK